MSDYCPANHPESPNGCFELSDHTGQHRGYRLGSYDVPFYWDDELVSPTFTEAELAILLVSLGPVKQFFPELVEKLERMRQAQQ